MANKISTGHPITPHQVQRRALWIACFAKGGTEYANKALDGFDAKFSEPGSQKIEVNADIHGASNEVVIGSGDTPADHPRRLKPCYVLDLTISGKRGSGKTTLLNWLINYLPTTIHLEGQEPIEVFRLGPKTTGKDIDNLAQKYGRVLIIQDQAE